MYVYLFCFVCKKGFLNMIIMKDLFISKIRIYLFLKFKLIMLLLK